MAGTLELMGKNRVHDLQKKGQAIQEDYNEIKSLYGEKIRKAKAQLASNLTTVVKDDEKMFLKMHQQQEEDQGEPPALIGDKGWGKGCGT